MPRILVNRATNQLSPYPRDDDEPVVGLDRNESYVVEVVREPEPEYDPDVFSLQPLEAIITISDPDGADANGTVTYGWELIELPPVVTPPPPPDWPAFLAALLQSATFGAAQIGAQQILHDELLTAEGIRQERLLRASTALTSLPAVLLAASQSGDPSLFIGAWISLRQAGLVAPDVATGMAQMATAYNLPTDLIRSLGAPEQPA
jgi:hypothetical protein